MVECYRFAVHLLKGKRLVKPLVRWLIAINVIVLAALFGRWFYQKQALRAEEQKRSEEARAGFARHGIMSKPVSANLFAIGDRIKQSDSISDEDLDWMVAEVNKTWQEATMASLNKRGMITMFWNGCGKWSPSQKEKIFQAALPMLRGKTSSDKTAGAAIATHLRDARGVPYLLAMTNDPDKNVREFAHRALKRMGYETASRQSSGQK